MAKRGTILQTRLEADQPTVSPLGPPQSWRLIPLEEVTLRTPQIDPARNPKPKFKYVDVSAISNEFLEIIGSTEYTRSEAPSRARKTIREGDILFATVRPSLKRIAVVPTQLDGQVCSTAFCVIRANQEMADQGFLFYAVSSDDFVGRVAANERGVSYPAVTDRVVLRETVALPPLEEQREIAVALSVIRRAQKATRGIIETAREMKKSLMASSFSNGGWPRGTLGSVATMIMGQSPPSEFYNTSGEGLPFLQGKAEFSERHPIPTKYCTQKLKLAPEGSVLMSVRAPVGDTNLADREYVIGRGVAALQLNGGSNEFLFYLLTYMKPQVEALGSGTTFDSVNKGSLAQLEVPVPPVEEQLRISTMLSTVDKKVTAEELRLAELTDLYQSLSSALLTGRIRIPTKGS